MSCKSNKYNGKTFMVSSKFPVNNNQGLESKLKFLNLISIPLIDISFFLI